MPKILSWLKPLDWRAVFRRLARLCTNLWAVSSAVVQVLRAHWHSRVSVDEAYAYEP